MPEGEPVAGVTSLGEEIYLLRDRARDQVEVYDVISYCLQCCLTVPNHRGFIDMTSCEHLLCLYISDHIAECIHKLRLDLHGNAQQWPVNDQPWGLSVNAHHNLIVTCRLVRKIKEFSPHGELVRDVILPVDVIHPWHAIQLTSGQFIVCHGGCHDPVHCVYKICSDGRHIFQSHGGQSGSDTGQYLWPWHLAVDDNEFVFVVDAVNRRVTLLSSTLEYVGQVVSRDHLNGRPTRVCLDVQRCPLYVSDNNDDGSKLTAGRVAVFSV